MPVPPQPRDVGISSITYCELEYGVARSTRPEANRAALAEFLAPLEILDFPAAAALPFGAVRAHLEGAGSPIGNYDLLIAVHAMQTGLTLVTNNTREFARIPGLHVENWADN